MSKAKFTNAISSLHPLVLIFSLIIVAAILTYVLPAGEFDRAADPNIGKIAVVASTYHNVEASPVSVTSMLLSIDKGIISVAPIIAFLMLVGGAFGVINSTGASGRSIDVMARL